MKNFIIMLSVFLAVSLKGFGQIYTDEVNVQNNEGQVLILGGSSNINFTNPGPLSIKKDDDLPFIGFHDAQGARQAYIQSRTDVLILNNEVAGSTELKHGASLDVSIENDGDVVIARGAISSLKAEISSLSGAQTILNHPGGPNAYRATLIQNDGARLHEAIIYFRNNGSMYIYDLYKNTTSLIFRNDGSGNLQVYENTAGTPKVYYSLTRVY